MRTTPILLILLLATAAQSAKAIDAYLCFQGQGCDQSCDCTPPITPLDLDYSSLGTISEVDGRFLRIWTRQETGQSYTDNICAVRIVGTPGNEEDWIETTMQTAYHTETEWGIALSAPPGEDWWSEILVTTNQEDVGIGAGYGANPYLTGWGVKVRPRSSRLGFHCDYSGPRAVSFSLVSGYSGGAVLYDGEEWSCGGLTPNPPGRQTATEVNGFVPDVFPLGAMTQLTAHYYPDFDLDGWYNVPVDMPEGWPDQEDNCGKVYNPDQADTNAAEDDNNELDGAQHYGNACDPDYDNNGWVGVSDYIILNVAYGKCYGDDGYDPDLDKDPTYYCAGGTCTWNPQSSDCIGMGEFLMLSSMLGQQMHPDPESGQGLVRCEPEPE